MVCSVHFPRVACLCFLLVNYIQPLSLVNRNLLLTQTPKPSHRSVITPDEVESLEETVIKNLQQHPTIHLSIITHPSSIHPSPAPPVYQTRPDLPNQATLASNRTTSTITITTTIIIIIVRSNQNKGKVKMSCPCSRCFSNPNPSTPHSEPSSPPPPYSPSAAASPALETSSSKKSTVGFPWFKKSSCSANPPRYSVESTASDLVGLLGRDRDRDRRTTTTQQRGNGVGSGVGGWTWSGEGVGR
ncbi:hypothetical protein B0H65DRAFT_207345 [Neurospora tetraspora]|uniref:Uncharacterized protein n=1 Tax=Neurospora tetraspora TaxID=94610 RepID=A0AAE0JFS8_9PEZI|nr:hypothetical protein B0H65DRAFT_207345 [Neurospora tetraspora]